MFAIYNNGSVAIRSSADNLYEVKNTEAPSEIYLKPDDDTLFEEVKTSNKEEQKKAPSNKAINAYKKMANIDTSDIVYHVRDIMTAKTIDIDINDTVMSAYEILKEHKVSQIPIVTEEKRIMGLINKKMILNLIVEDLDNSKNTLERKLNDLYLPELITTDPISDIRRVAKVMIDFRLDAIPVVNENHILVGIVSKTDIIKAVSHLKLQLWS